MWQLFGIVTAPVLISVQSQELLEEEYGFLLAKYNKKKEQVEEQKKAKKQQEISSKLQNYPFAHLNPSRKVFRKTKGSCKSSESLE